MARRIWLFAALTLLAAACGDDDDATARTTIASSTTTPATSIAPVTTAAATSASPTTPPPATTVVATTLVAVTAPTARCAEPPAFDSATPLRDQFVGYLVGCGFTQLESACLFDHLEFDDPAVLAGETDAMLPAFQACDIDASRMAEIGGA
jgi:hypothetical protein